MARACVCIFVGRIGSASARLPSHVVCGGAAYITASRHGLHGGGGWQGRTKVVAEIAESLTQTQIDCVCDWLLSRSTWRRRAEEGGSEFPPLLGYSVDNFAGARLATDRLDWTRGAEDGGALKAATAERQKNGTDA